MSRDDTYLVCHTVHHFDNHLHALTDAVMFVVLVVTLLLCVHMWMTC